MTLGSISDDLMYFSPILPPLPPSFPASPLFHGQVANPRMRGIQIHKPSACTPLFLAAFKRGAGCCIHTHSQWAVLVTLLVERDFGPSSPFEIEEIEQIKGIPKGRGKQ